MKAKQPVRAVLCIQSPLSMFFIQDALRDAQILAKSSKKSFNGVYAHVAQWLEHHTDNVGVGSSTLPMRTLKVNIKSSGNEYLPSNERNLYRLQQIAASLAQT